MNKKAFEHRRIPIFKKDGIPNYRHHYGIRFVFDKDEVSKIYIKSPTIDFKEYPDLEKYNEEATIILSLIRTSHQIIYNHGNFKSTDEFYCIPFNNFRKIVGRHQASIVIDLLIKYKIIERDETFWFLPTDESSIFNPVFKNGKTKGYKLAEKIRTSHSEQRLLTNKRLINSIKKHFLSQHREIINQPIESMPMHHQKLYNDLKEIEIDDFQEAVKKVKNHFIDRINKIKEDDLQKKHERILEQKQAIVNAVDALRDIKEHSIRFTICKYGRVHTNITNLISIIRPNLTYKKKTLKNIDINNSQPCFLSQLCKNILSLNKEQNKQKIFFLNKTFNENNDFIKNKKLYEKYNNQLINEYERLDILEIIYNKLIVDDILINRDSLKEKVRLDTDDIERFYLETAKFDRICNGGYFYEELFGVKCLTGRRRKEKKDSFFAFLFGEVMNCPEVEKIFQRKFPTILKYINRIKKDYYQELARLLQKFESEAMIENVVKQIAEIRPDIPIFTIHDSIMTTSEHVSYVYGTIKRVLKDKFDMNVTLSVEAY